MDEGSTLHGSINLTRPPLLQTSPPVHVRESTSRPPKSCQAAPLAWLLPRVLNDRYSLLVVDAEAGGWKGEGWRWG